MFIQAYKEVSETDEALLRGNEREALKQILDLMNAANAAPRDAVKRVSAIQQTFLVWGTLLEALVSRENELSDELKANLISIAIFNLKHLQSMRIDTTKNFQPLIEPTLILIEGLK